MPRYSVGADRLGDPLNLLGFHLHPGELSQQLSPLLNHQADRPLRHAADQGQALRGRSSAPDEAWP